MNKISFFNSITKLHCRSVLAQVASLASICAVSVQPVCTSRSDNLEVLEKCVHGKVLVYGKGSRLGESQDFDFFWFSLCLSFSSGRTFF